MIPKLTQSQRNSIRSDTYTTENWTQMHQTPAASYLATEDGQCSAYLEPTSSRALTLAAEPYTHRTCPGRYFANSSLFINIALILHTLDITPPLDEQGKAIVIEHKMTDTLAT